MARPKKAPRERFQITLPKPTGRNLRALAKKWDREISQVVDDAVSRYIVENERQEKELARVSKMLQPQAI